MMSNPEKKAFKHWFDEAAARQLADLVVTADTSFDRTRFLDLATDGLAGLEFHGRVIRFSDALADTLSANRKEALRILIRSLPPPLPDCKSVTDGWLLWPLGQFIADHGTNERDTAFEAMTELTQRFSAEFAVRPFAEQDPENTIRRLSALTGHQSPHVRRWCSEGLRPRLPWGRKLHAFIRDPAPVLPILEALKADPEPYVRKSVANHLNDISKDHPDLVIQICRTWVGNCSQTDWIVRHGLRTLIKDGHPGAMSLLGYSPPVDIQASLHIKPDRISIGEKVTLTLGLNNSGKKDRNLLIDYAVHFVRKNGQTNAKVFKWKTLNLPAGQTQTLYKTHAFKPTSIRALYPGTHNVRILVNGHVLAEAGLELGKPKPANG